MLATELKIKNLKKQRTFIEKQLMIVGDNQDGDISYTYVGHVYAEVIEYFEKEGFNVIKVQNDQLTAATKGLPIYLFVVNEDVHLTKKEKDAAEAVELASNPEQELREFVTSFEKKYPGVLQSTMFGVVLGFEDDD